MGEQDVFRILILIWGMSQSDLEKVQIKRNNTEMGKLHGVSRWMIYHPIYSADNKHETLNPSW